jgi:hypothetical protein
MKGKISRRRQHELRFPERARARHAVKYALKIGALTRSEKCERCDKIGFTQAHHPDYNKPLQVEWLCHECHRDVNGSSELDAPITTGVVKLITYQLNGKNVSKTIPGAVKKESRNYYILFYDRDVKQHRENSNTNSLQRAIELRAQRQKEAA